MIKNLLTLTLSFSTLLLISQNSAEAELATLETPEQVQSYLKHKNSKLLTFNEEKHKTKLSKELLSLNLGNIKTTESEFENTYYKVIKKTKRNYYRASYILLDASKSHTDEIKSIRKNIISQFKNGVTFNFLAQQYSIDKNAYKGGDLGWFTLDQVHPNLAEEIVNGAHRLNQIFTVEVPSEKKYYLVVITDQPKKIKEVDVLKIVKTK